MSEVSPFLKNDSAAVKEAMGILAITIGKSTAAAPALAAKFLSSSFVGINSFTFSVSILLKESFIFPGIAPILL